MYQKAHTMRRDDSDSSPPGHTNYPGYPSTNGATIYPQQYAITRIIFLKKPPTLRDALPFAFVFTFYALAIYVLFAAWRRAHKKSFELFMFFLVFIFPPVVLLSTGDRILLGLWVCQIAVMCYSLRKALKRPLDPEAPREIYKTFKHLFFITNTLVFLGYAITILSFFFFTGYALSCLRLFVYFSYIAILCREFARNLCYFMAKSTGFFSSGESVPGRQEKVDACMLCGVQFGNTRDSVVTINCKHSFHNECIKGWCHIGHNDFCPYCKQGIDHSFIPRGLWEKSEYSLRPVLNLLRSFIAQFIIIFTIFMYRKRIDDW